jgi:DhnA family fructose-bisphosphate aldolase class Ia
MRDSFDPGAVIEVAQEGKVMAMAVLPGLGQVIGQMTKGDIPLIWKLNIGAGIEKNGDAITTPLYSDIRTAMKVAIDNGAIAWGATYYEFSTNAPAMRRQLTEMDEAGAELGLGGVVWNYPRGSLIKGGDSDVLNQLHGFESIYNVTSGSFVFIKEKVSTPTGTVKDWETGKLEKDGWGKPEKEGFDDTEIRRFLSLNRADMIRYLVGVQHDHGIGSLMSGGAPQDPERFGKDVKDGIGADRHIAFIAGRSTTRQIKKTEESFNVNDAIGHMKKLNAAAPRVVIED